MKGWQTGAQTMLYLCYESAEIFYAIINAFKKKNDSRNRKKNDTFYNFSDEKSNDFQLRKWWSESCFRLRQPVISAQYSVCLRTTRRVRHWRRNEILVGCMCHNHNIQLRAAGKYFKIKQQIQWTFLLEAHSKRRTAPSTFIFTITTHKY